MQSEWRSSTVGQEADILLGYAFKSAAFASEPPGYRLLRGDNVKRGSIEWGDKSRYWPTWGAELQRYVLRPGDVVVGMDGSRVGENFAVVADSDLPALLVQRVACLRARDGLHQGYLRYLICNPDFTRYIKSVQTGTSIPHISARQIADFEIDVPPLHEQGAIASMLQAIDGRIDVLRQTNITLESIAKTLFKSWFVDFDPVRAKAENREPEGMGAAAAALFPSEFENSALGMIPKGWQVRSLDSFATYLNGLAMQKFPPESDVEYLPVIKIAQLRAGNTIGSDRASAHLKPEYVVHDGDVLFSWSGSLEVELWCGGVGALNQHLFKVTSDEMPKWFYYLATRHFLPGFREIAAHKATTMGHIQRKHLTDSRLAIPPESVVRELGTILGPLLERRIANALQVRELASLRDSLLPRLISGKLRLPGVQAQPEEATA